MRRRIGSIAKRPAAEKNRPPTSASDIAVWTEADSLSFSWAPKYCPQMTAQPAPTPTVKPTARSVRAIVAWMPPTAALPANWPTMKVLMRVYACWKNELTKMGTHSCNSCCQMTPSVTSRERSLVRGWLTRPHRPSR